ncbi:MAG: hypothetical protein WC508_03045 [Patescibacteria group bacterium]
MPKTIIAVVEKIPLAAASQRWRAELKGNSEISVCKATWQQAAEALRQMLEAEECQVTTKTYEVEHRLFYPDTELISYRDGKRACGDPLMTYLRNSHIESCRKCQQRLAELSINP